MASECKLLVHGMDPKNSLARVFRERAAAVSRAYARAVLGEEEAVHGLRVAVRRMRVALRLLASHPGGKKVRRADKRLKSLAEAAGISRDLDVGRPHLARLRAGAPARDPGWASLARSYAAARRRERRQDAEALLDCELARLRRSLRDLAGSGLAEIAVVERRLDALVRDKGSRLLEDLRALDPRTDAETLHALRRRIRRFRYAAELGAKLPDRPETHRGWRGAQNALGEIQDRRVLAAWLETWSREKQPRRRPEARTIARHAAAALRAEADDLQRDLVASGMESVREALAAMRPAVSQRDVGRGVPFPKVQPAITLISG